MDEADRSILRAIQANPDLTMRELGEMTGLSHTPCWRRLNKLREEGIISDKRYVLDAQKLGYEIVAFCHVHMATHAGQALNEFEAAVAKVPEVVQCYSAAGDLDYILKVLAQNLRAYEETVKHKLLQLPHVATISTSLALKEVKNTPNIPI